LRTAPFPATVARVVSSGEKPAPAESTRAPRAELGVWAATALVVGHTIGVGVFLTPAEILGTLASPAWVLGLWLGVGALVVCGAMTYGELAARIPAGGGLYAYVRRAWGEGLAALYGWQCLLVLDPGITAALAAGLAGYASILWPSGPSPRWIAVAAIWILAVPPMLGLRAGARFNLALTAVKLALIAAFVILAFTAGSGSWAHVVRPEPRPAGAKPLGEAIAIGLVGVFYSFGGFWEAPRVADRMRDPRRTAARALLLGVAATTLAYVATTLAFLYLVPAAAVTDPAAFARQAGVALLGARGPAILAAAIVLSAAGSAAALLLMAPHMYLAMADDGALPARLVRSDARPSRPVRGTVLLATLASVLALAGSFRQIVAFFMFPMLLFLIAAAAALFLLRRREPASPGFRVPLHPLTPALFVVLLSAVAAAVAIAQPVPSLAGTAVILAAGALHSVLGRPRRVRVAP
jgi:APA family basic amino acid/polyamine antiporter